MSKEILVNRAPGLTLWGCVVAERLGYDADAALSLGKCLSGLTAQVKGRRLGIFSQAKTADGKLAPKSGLGEEMWVELAGKSLPAVRTAAGVRAVVKDRPIEPAGVEKYLRQKFGDDLPAVRAVMTELARSYTPQQLNELAFGLYERFRPSIPPGQAGWGAKGKLDLEAIKAMRPSEK